MFQIYLKLIWPKRQEWTGYNIVYSFQARLFFLFSIKQRPEFLSNFGWPDYLFYLQKLPDPSPRGINWLSPKQIRKYTHSQYNGSIKVTHSKATIYEINIAALYNLWSYSCALNMRKLLVCWNK